MGASMEKTVSERGRVVDIKGNGQLMENLCKELGQLTYQKAVGESQLQAIDARSDALKREIATLNRVDALEKENAGKSPKG